MWRGGRTAMAAFRHGRFSKAPSSERRKGVVQARGAPQWPHSLQDRMRSRIKVEQGDKEKAGRGFLFFAFAFSFALSFVRSVVFEGQVWRKVRIGIPIRSFTFIFVLPFPFSFTFAFAFFRSCVLPLTRTLVPTLVFAGFALTFVRTFKSSALVECRSFALTFGRLLFRFGLQATMWKSNNPSLQVLTQSTVGVIGVSQQQKPKTHKTSTNVTATLFTTQPGGYLYADVTYCYVGSSAQLLVLLRDNCEVSGLVDAVATCLVCIGALVWGIGNGIGPCDIGGAFDDAGTSASKVLFGTAWIPGAWIAGDWIPDGCTLALWCKISL